MHVLHPDMFVAGTRLQSLVAPGAKRISLQR
jgi:hypothetical protein